MDIETIIIDAKPSTFKATIETNLDDSGDYYRIRFGGEMQCVYIIVTSFEDYASFNNATHNEKCSLSESLSRSDGTIKMIRTALKFVCERYKHVKGFLFNDGSWIQCEQDTKVCLHDLYIAKKARTWYHDKFGAMPFLEHDKASYMSAMHRYEQLRIGHTTPQIFYDAYIAPYYETIKIKGKKAIFDFIKRKLNELMPKHTHYIELFKELMSVKENGEYLDCIVYNKWVQVFIRANVPVDIGNMEWIISKECVTAWNIPLAIKSSQKDMNAVSYWGGGSRSVHGKENKKRYFVPSF
jgi:hypothetical protein